MTRTRTSLLLTALLVVAGATAGLSGAVASNAGVSQSSANTYQAQDDGIADAPVDSGEVYWQGQFLRFSGGEANASEVWAVREVQNGEVGSLVTEVLLDGSGSAVVSTSNLDGQYVVVNEDEQPVAFQNGQAQQVSSVNEASFEVAAQTLNASFDAATVANDDSPDARADLRIQSNRAGYGAYLVSDELSNQQLADIFSDVQVQNDRAVITRNVSGDAVFDADFSGVEAGTYNVSVVAADGAAEGTATITVSEPVEGSAGLSNATITEQRGDVVRFNVTFEETERATVTIGSREVGYLARFDVVDENGDGVVTVEFDSYRAGLTADEAAVSVTGEDSLQDFNLVTNPLSDRLDAANYPVSVSVGGRETAVGVLDLNERSTDGMQVWTAPDRESVESVSGLTEVATQDSDVAFQDWVVVQVQASGLYSYVQNVSDLNDNETGLSTSLVTSGEINVPAQNVSLDQARLLVDEEGNQFFLVLDSNVLEEGNEYQATFNVTDANPYVEAGNGTSLTTNFTVVNRTASFDQPVEVSPSSEATISGSSTVAPGTELTIEAQNTGDSPFIKRQTATVNEDGTWEATFDFSDVSPNTNFSVSVVEPSVNATGTVVSEGAGAQQTTTEAETTQAETTAEDGAATETTAEEGADEETTEAEAGDEGVVGDETTEAGDEAATETPANGETTTAETTTVAEAATAPAPGFGAVVTAVAIGLLLAGGALALRRR